MPLLHFDCPSSDLLADDQRLLLKAWRDRFVAQHAVDFENGKNRDQRLPDDLPFWALPEQLLHAYEKHRENSELGQVFRIANGLHDQVDALLIVAEPAQLLQVRAVIESGCDPFHNELSRAHRGSKPRIYYLRPDDSSDVIQAVLGRLDRGGYGDGIAESRWAMVAIAPPPVDGPVDGQVDGQAPATPSRSAFERLVFDVLLPRLPTLNDSPATDALPHPFTLICHQDDPLLQRMPESAHKQMLCVPRSLPLGCQVLSPVVLLPAAFLGFDCVQLLVGAAELNRNLVEADFSSNLVLQLLAHAIRGGAQRRQTHRFVALDPSLESLCRWANHACRFDLPESIDNESASQPAPLPVLATRWLVGRQRSDQLMVDGRPWQDWQADRMSGEFAADFAEIHLPVIEPNALGQLVQWVMIAGQMAAAEG